MNTFTQALLRYLTPEQLRKVQSKKIGIGGAGGLGSNVAMVLIRTGFANLEIIDKDVVEASNLNRQDYTLADIGRAKVEALKDRLLSVNPDATVIAHSKAWDENAAQDIFKECAIIIEAFDKAEWKKRFVDHYRHRASYVISGNGMAGLAPTTEISVRRIGNIYLVGDGITSIDDGNPPLAPRVMECAAKMAGITLRLTL